MSVFCVLETIREDFCMHPAWKEVLQQRHVMLYLFAARLGFSSLLGFTYVWEYYNGIIIIGGFDDGSTVSPKFARDKVDQYLR